MKEIRVVTQNRPGEMNKIAQTLGENGVNMLAVCGYNINKEGRIHLVVSDHKKGMSLVKKMKYKATEGEVLMLELKHSPGELSRLTALLAKAGVNIEVLYGSGSSYPSAQLVIGVDDLKKAEAALRLD